MLTSTERPSTVLVRGRVSWFDCRRGYGFVRCADGAVVFVHFRAIRGWTGRVEVGQEIEFERRSPVVPAPAAAAQRRTA